MSAPAKTVAEELTEIAARLYEDGRREGAAGGATPERMFALGLAAGAVLRVLNEHTRAKPPEKPAKEPDERDE
jgi:hypothetical protein